MKSRLTLVALFAVFFAPVLLAVLLHSEWVAWQAAPEKAHGELVEPVVPLGSFRLQDAAGRKRGPDDLAGRWQLATVRRAPCGSACIESLTLLRNVRVAQDRHMDEVGLVLLARGRLDERTVARLQAMDRAWTVFDGSAARRLLQRFPDVVTGASYIVDPDGNIMERFGPDSSLNGVREDLDRLLTWTVREQQ